MTFSQDPSILQYAEFHNIAEDTTLLNPLSFIDDAYADVAAQHEPDPVRAKFEKRHDQFERDIETAKLDINYTEARLLSDALHLDETSDWSINWDRLLLPSGRADPLKDTSFLLTAEEDPLAFSSVRGDVDGDVAMSGTVQADDTAGLERTSQTLLDGGGGALESDRQVPCPSLNAGDQHLKQSHSEHHSYARFTPRGLGSLSAFMETRGLSTTDDSLKSPQFPSSESKDTPQQEQSEPNPAMSTISSSELPSPSHVLHPPPPPPQTPDSPKKDTEPSLLFLSTTLLKTHVRVIQCLENKTITPRLIYRDYDQPLTRLLPESEREKAGVHPQQDEELTNEADVIISPSTGIILTTSQAATQKYLPGHKPSDDDLYIQSQPEIDSPLRERIYRLALRYEYLYVLLCHPSFPVKESGPSNMDARTRNSIGNLRAFCISLGRKATVRLLVTAADPVSVSRWIRTVAYKHEGLLRRINTRLRSRSESAEGTARLSVQQMIKEEETIGEVHYRLMGLNPFAARVFLDVPGILGPSAPNRDGEDTSIGEHNEPGQPCRFSVFAGLSPEEQCDEFEELFGERVLKRFAS
ncbi:hypothetical protein NUU61_004518 [Penicillium alfredii]|uniref:Uncharacterized protein n=1 Tax=Penicillium alfredii TaxID=1506179 RepID=A0A9W9FLA0_9EURO|nr:uncharacterized protein NUU61_004518 [Penicillium alfredii]KAJ5102296.1 hypothetical protein NUU61_004518 [Penicillium alfredii]